ncbi:MAG: outer membrane protein assembly factor BamB, partial [Oceanobacter sp.]
MVIGRNFCLTLVLASLLAGCSSSPTTEANFKTVENQSVSDVSSGLLDVVWRTRLGTGPGREYIRMQTVLDGKRIYAADPAGGLYALNFDTGLIQWHRELEEKIIAGISLARSGDQSYLLASTVDGRLSAFDPQNGDQLWSNELTSEAVSPAGFDGERAYVHTVDGRITAVNLASGESLWSYEVQQPVLTVRGTATPVIQDGLVIVGTANGKVVALDSRLGIPRWEYRLAFPDGRSELERLVDVDGTVVPFSNLIFAASYHGKVAAIAMNGTVRWEEDASSYTSPVISVGNLYMTLDNGDISARSLDSGDKVWTQSLLQGSQVSGVSVVGKYLTVTDGEGFLYLLNRLDGSFLARKDLRPVIRHVSVPNQPESTRWRELRGKDFGIRSPVVSANSGMLVYTNDGVLIRVDIE